MKRVVFFLFLLFVFVSCVVDNVGPTDYSEAEPVYFDISIDNQSLSDKEVIFERISEYKPDASMNDTLDAPMNKTIVYKNIVCIDNRWEREFMNFPTGMHGKSVISVVVGG